MSQNGSSGETRVIGACHHDCPDTCGWEVTVREGVAVKIRGLADHPYSQGELCPKVNRILDRVYHPDRVLYPLIRTGAKGSAEFRRATWEEALALVVDRVGSAMAEYGGETVAQWGDAGTQGLLQMNSMNRRFFGRLGASRQVDSLCGATALAGTALTLGGPLASDPLDIRHSKYIILWGTNTRLTNRHLWPFIEEARAAGAKVVVIDPVRTITAEVADWFIRPRPGTDVAMMLAMMHIIIRDGYLDRDYVDSYTEGFDELARHVADWTPERASAVCGVSVDDIETLTREYATNAPAFIRTLIGAEHHREGGTFFRALACLPTLIGAWRYRGGGLARSVGSYADAVIDDSVFDLTGAPMTRGLSMNQMGRWLTDSELSPPVKAVFIWNGNPVATAPNAALTKTGLSRDDLFTVVSEQFVTDTARYADVVFPACTQIEQFDVVPAWGHFYAGVNNKAIEPLGESVPNTELWRRLAKAFGFTDQEFTESDESLVRSAIHDVDLDAAVKRGWFKVVESANSYAEGRFPSPSGRARLAGDWFESVGLDRVPDYREHPADAYPLTLMSPKTHQRFLNSSYSQLQAHAGPEGSIYCEIHPDDARSRSINDGDRVRVRNERASLTMVAHVPAEGGRVAPGMVIVPFGWVGARTEDGSTVNDLTNDEDVNWGGGVAFFDTSVEVERV